MQARQRYPQCYGIHCDGHSIRFEDLPDGKSIRAVLEDFKTGSIFFDYTEIEPAGFQQTIQDLRALVEAKMQAHRTRLAVPL